MIKRDSNHYWGLLAVVLLALVVRLPLLGGSFWLDEAAQALESSRPLSQQLDIIPDFQPPLFHLVVHVLLTVSGSEAWLRFGASVVPALLTVALVYEIGRKWWGTKAALVAAGILSLNSLHVFFSQELRPYSLPALWAVLGWWLILRQTKPVGWRWWGCFSLVGLLGLFTTYLYPFVLATQYMYVLGRWPKQWRSLLASGMAVSGGFLVWLPMFLQQLAAGGQVRLDLPGWSQVVSTPQLKALPMVALKFVFGVLNIEPTVGFVGSMVLLAVMVGAIGWQQRQQLLPAVAVNKWRQLVTSPLFILLVWLVVPIVSAWIVSFWIPVLQPKRVLYTLPAWCLIVAYLTTVVKSQVWLQRALLGLVLSVQMVSLIGYYTQPILQREDWRSLHATIQARYPVADTVVVFAFPEPYAPWRWYDDYQYPTLSTGTLSIKDVADVPQLLKPMTRYKYIVVFDYLRSLSDPDDEIGKTIAAFGYVPVEIIDYPNIGFTRIYAQGAAAVSQQPSLEEQQTTYASWN